MTTEKQCTKDEWTELAKGLLDRGRCDIAAMLVAPDGVTKFIDRGVVHHSPFSRRYVTRDLTPPVRTPAQPVAQTLATAPAAPPSPPSPPTRRAPPAPPMPIDFLDELVEESTNDNGPSFSAPSADATMRARAAFPGATNSAFISEQAAKIDEADAARDAAAVRERHVAEAFERRKRLLGDADRTVTNAAAAIEVRGFEELVPDGEVGGFEDLTKDEGDDDDAII